MDLVQQDLTTLSKLRKTGIPPDMVQFEDPNVIKEFDTATREAIQYNAILHDLFDYIFHIRCPDLPVDLFESAVWVLKTLLLPWENGTLRQLRAIGYLDCPESKFDNMKLGMLSNMWWKLAFYLLHESVDRPSEAAPYLRKFIDMVEARLPSAWLLSPDLYALYGEALAREGKNDKRAREMLELFFKASSSVCGVEFLIRARVWLARVLRRLNEPKKAEAHEAIAIRWFQTNDHGKEEHAIKRLLMPDDKTVEPILEALGGAGWLKGHRVTARMFHNISRSCGCCDARQVQRKLARCSKCQDIYYCSTECQKADWPAHKGKCKLMANTLRTVEILKQTNPKASERLARWKVWRTEAYYNEALMHALNVHRDPIRGRTHILVEFIEYTPHASKDLQYKFKVLHCAVFKVSDILSNMKMIFGPVENDITRDVQETLLLFSDMSLQTKPDKVPLMSLKMGKGLEPWLSLTFVQTETLRHLPHNPEWRTLFNKGAKPGALKLAALKLKNREEN
ncbi:hypothetical protein M422DRAFT_782745 [Sphaerobolus stellatus SS14]|uniref:MYND-type domain-containing protein n=1 Tax=Sphaerobolus stellatus (strain SS14) TaxID=990650 RepID=A0A0C9VBJ8_SPHS4|nr:hypothetical protein M422DRAFT_782745 [Sphaerobolus stellatus SS14]